LVGIVTVLIIVLFTHKIAAMAGPSWVFLSFLYYSWHRRSKRLPVFRSVARDWEKEQKQVLESAEEFDLLEQYRLALGERDRLKRKLSDAGKQE